jgi:hypothetical protein
VTIVRDDDLVRGELDRDLGRVGVIRVLYKFSESDVGLPDQALAKLA